MGLFTLAKATVPEPRLLAFPLRSPVFNEGPVDQGAGLQQPSSLAAASRRSAAARRIPLPSGLFVDLLHQGLQRAPANFTEVAVVVRHELLVAAGAIDMDASPAQIIVCFAKAAIANKRRFRTHRGLPLAALGMMQKAGPFQ
jgi:hypothetical protein